MKAYIQTVGRRYPEDDKGVSDPFLKDYFRIIESYAYRRLPYKTQVMPVSENSHMTTRAAHTNEVISASGKIAYALGLDTSLCMAIAAGHDIGHPPFGHNGERILGKLGFKPFKHNANSVVILQHIENGGKGVNLDFESLDGIFKHTRGKGKIDSSNGPDEYNVVTLADKIYVYTDFEDAIKHGYLSRGEIPDFAFRLGKTTDERKNLYIDAIISESKEKGKVIFSEGPVFEDFEMQKRYNYDELYPNIDSDFHRLILESACEFFSKDKDFSGADPIHTTSFLSDVEIDHFTKLLLKYKKPPKDQIIHYGVFELLPVLTSKKIDYTDPDLAWGEELMRTKEAKTP